MMSDQSPTRTRGSYTGRVRWAFFRREVIRDSDGTPYLTRLRVLQTPLFAIYLHWIHRPDADAELHDHPWSFASVILRGGYTEEREGQWWWWYGERVRLRSSQRRGWLSIAIRRATDLHRISDVKPNTVSLVLCGPRVREWGFQTINGWMNWRDFLRVRRGEKPE